MRLGPNVTAFDLNDSELYDGCRVWAYVTDWEGLDAKSTAPSELMRPRKPERPTALQVVRRSLAKIFGLKPNKKQS